MRRNDMPKGQIFSFSPSLGKTFLFRNKWTQKMKFNWHNFVEESSQNAVVQSWFLYIIIAGRDLIYFCQSINKKVSFRSDHFYDSISRAIIYSKNDLQAKSELGGLPRKLLLPLTFLAIYKKKIFSEAIELMIIICWFSNAHYFRRGEWWGGGADNCNGNLINFLDAPRKKCDYF